MEDVHLISKSYSQCKCHKLKEENVMMMLLVHDATLDCWLEPLFEEFNPAMLTTLLNVNHLVLCSD